MKRLVISLLGLGLLAGNACADGDAAKGEQAFKVCAACHSIADKANKVGPSLVGVVGRKVAVAEGFSYSAAMKKLGETGAVWDEKTLDTYLTDPRAFVAGTKMSLAGIKDEQKRADLIAFLKTKM